MSTCRRRGATIIALSVRRHHIKISSGSRVTLPEPSGLPALATSTPTVRDAAAAAVAALPVMAALVEADDWVTAANGEAGAEPRRVRLSSFRALVLDSSYKPIEVVGWQRAVRLPCVCTRVNRELCAGSELRALPCCPELSLWESFPHTLF